ncbi:hypothetical protein [Qipengyuania intermedia]|uniref:hypothetical protein n=1 Tax=Qipengyuania intermedia TaxID=2867244 RepID=UPI001FFD2F9B|nr:hypothetical protein [Qipengyuania intermedia]
MKFSAHLFPAIGLATALAACSPAPADILAPEDQSEPLVQVIEEQARTDPVENCLLLVWSEQEDPDVEFDRANDAVNGGAISCATGTSPSQFEAAIETLREAAQSGDKARLLEQVGLPLLYIDADGERRELSEDQIDTLFDEVFDERMVAVLRDLDLSQMTVDKEQGAYFELGSLWLVVDDTGGKPRIVTVNRQALEEAAEAAKEQAERGQGKRLD